MRLVLVAACRASTWCAASWSRPAVLRRDAPCPGRGLPCFDV